MAAYDSSNAPSHNIAVVNYAFNAPLIPISVFGNTLTLVAILRTPSLRSPSTILLLSLAVSDLLVGLVVQPTYIAFNLTGIPSIWKAADLMAFVLCGVSLLTMTAIAVDRFLALRYHMRYPNLMTKSRAFYLSTVFWITTISLSLVTFYSRRVFEVASISLVVICVTTCTASYVRIYFIVRRHQLQIQVQQQAVAHLVAENNQNIQRSTRNAKNTFIYYIVMILCFSPFFISYSLLSISKNQWAIEWIFAETIVFMNSPINPFLYCWRLSDLRAAVIKTARWLLCKESDVS